MCSLAIIQVEGLLSATASRHKADIGYRGKLKALNKTCRERTLFLVFSNFAPNQIVSINLVVKKGSQVAMLKPLLLHSAQSSFFFFHLLFFRPQILFFESIWIQLSYTQRLYLNQLEDLMTRGIKRYNIDVWPGSFPEINLNCTPENTFGKYQLRR